MSNSRSQLEHYLAGLDVNADRVLDIGGSQLPVKGRTKSWEVKDYKILDLELPHECKQAPDIICDLNIGQDVLDATYKYKKYFDTIFCLEVSEYIINPFFVLEMLSFMLKEKGILYISFHFLYPIHKPHGLDYLRYTEYGAIKLLEMAGFEIESISYKLLNRTGRINYDAMDIAEGNKRDHDANHTAQGYIIKAVKK